MGEIIINQRAAMGSDTTQVAVQNNYTGLSAQDASKIAIDLFIENFPKLQQVAEETAKRRAEEIVGDVISKLSNNGVSDYSAFADPDVQFVLWEAQKNYARFGTESKRRILSDLVGKRIQYNGETYLNTITDRAIEAVGYLSEEHVNCLSLMFICKRVKMGKIKTFEDLINILRDLDSRCPVSNQKAYNLLYSLGCLEIDIDSAESSLKKSYGFSEETILLSLPPSFKNLNPDYGPSDVGVIIAITNLEAKSELRFNVKTWFPN